MRGDSALGEERRVRGGRQLRPRGDGVPQRRALWRALGSSRSVCAGRGEHRTPAGRAGDRLCFAGHESQGSELTAVEQGEVGSGCLGGCGTERADGGRCNRYCDGRRDSFLLAKQGIVCRNIVRGFYSALRWQRQRETVREKIERKRNHRGAEGGSSGLRAGTGVAAEQKIADGQVGSQVAGVNRRYLKGHPSPSESYSAQPPAPFPAAGSSKLYDEKAEGQPTAGALRVGTERINDPLPR